MGQWERPRSIGERLKNNQHIIFNGDIDGQIKTFPNDIHLPNEDELSGDGSGPDILFYNETFTISSTGNQSLSFTFEPLTYSEHIYWCPAGGGGVYLEEGEDWQKTSPSSVVVNGSYMDIGDQLVVEYAYDPNTDLAD
jgi:hypothetical protein